MDANDVDWWLQKDVMNVTLNDSDSGGMLYLIDGLLREERSTPPKQLIERVLNRMVDVAEWVKRGQRDVFKPPISDVPVRYVDPFLETVQPLRQALGEGDPYTAAWAALNAAYRFALLAAQWEVCLHYVEDHEWATFTARQGKASNTQTRHKAIRDALRRRLEDHPHDSLTYARRRVAVDSGLSETTIKRATKGMKKPPVKRAKRK